MGAFRQPQSHQDPDFTEIDRRRSTREPVVTLGTIRPLN
jgi:hypothetical protein